MGCDYFKESSNVSETCNNGVNYFASGVSSMLCYFSADGDGGIDDDTEVADGEEEIDKNLYVENADCTVTKVAGGSFFVIIGTNIKHNGTSYGDGVIKIRVSMIGDKVTAFEGVHSIFSVPGISKPLDNSRMGSNCSIVLGEDGKLYSCTGGKNHSRKRFRVDVFTDTADEVTGVFDDGTSNLYLYIRDNGRYDGKMITGIGTTPCPLFSDGDYPLYAGVRHADPSVHVDYQMGTHGIDGRNQGNPTGTPAGLTCLKTGTYLYNTDYVKYGCWYPGHPSGNQNVSFPATHRYVSTKLGGLGGGPIDKSASMIGKNQYPFYVTGKYGNVITSPEFVAIYQNKPYCQTCYNQINSPQGGGYGNFFTGMNIYNDTVIIPILSGPDNSSTRYNGFWFSKTELAGDYLNTHLNKIIKISTAEIVEISHSSDLTNRPQMTIQGTKLYQVFADHTEGKGLTVKTTSLASLF